MANTLSGKTVAVLATDGVELVELNEPMKALKDAGAEITLASPEGGQPPLDPKSDDESAQTDATRRFKADAEAQQGFQSAMNTQSKLFNGAIEEAADGSIVTREVPGSFYEFITRKRTFDQDARRWETDLRFDAGNAQGIFKMTASQAA